jgi:hypothetical protein
MQSMQMLAFAMSSVQESKAARAAPDEVEPEGGHKAPDVSGVEVEVFKDLVCFS